VNLTDLRDELDARSVPGEGLLDQARLSGVQARIGAIRRRRMAGTAAALVVVTAVVIGYGVLPWTSATPAPGEGPSVVDGFPEYAVGARVVATGSAPLQDRITMTAAVGERGVAVTSRCEDVPDTVSVWLVWRANGRQVASMTCGAGGYSTTDPTEWAKVGARPGEPVAFTVEVDRVTQPGTGPDQVVAVSGGTFTVAVMDRLPFEDYPFPPRPAELVPFSRAAENVQPDGALAVVESDPADPNATRTVTVTVPVGARLDMAAQTPGLLRVSVGGRTVTTGEWWDYDVGIQGYVLRDGEVGTGSVTITFTPQHMTGAWRAVIHL
jgi:hypothetical protein